MKQKLIITTLCLTTFLVIFGIAVMYAVNTQSHKRSNLTEVINELNMNYAGRVRTGNWDAVHSNTAYVFVECTNVESFLATLKYDSTPQNPRFPSRWGRPLTFPIYYDSREGVIWYEVNDYVTYISTDKV